MATFTARQRLQSPTYVAGAKQSVNLPRGYVWREMYLRLTSQPTVTAGNNTVAKTQPGDQWAAITTAAIVANGSNTIFSMSGKDLYWLNRAVFRANPSMNPTLGDGATANPSLDDTLVIPFWSPDSKRPFDTALYTGEMSDLRIDITWATPGYSNISSSATGWTVQPTLELEAYVSELPILNSASAGKVPLLPPLLKRIVPFTQVVSGTTANFRFPLDVGGPAYRRFLIQQTTTATPPVDTGAQFVSAQLVSGGTTFWDMSESMMFQLSRLPNGIINGFSQQKVQTTGLGLQVSPRISGSTSEAGNYIVDICADGNGGNAYLTEAINTANLSELYWQFQTQLAGTIQIYAEQLISLNRAPLPSDVARAA